MNFDKTLVEIGFNFKVGDTLLQFCFMAESSIPKLDEGEVLKIFDEFYCSLDDELNFEVLCSMPTMYKGKPYHFMRFAESDFDVCNPQQFLLHLQKILIHVYEIYYEIDYDDFHLAKKEEVDGFDWTLHKYWPK